MEYKEILFDVSDWIATITLSRPEKLNAWTFTMEAEYRHAMAEARIREVGGCPRISVGAENRSRPRADVVACPALVARARRAHPR